MVNDADAQLDAITGLKAPTNFGRPNWDRVFRGIRQLHPATDVGVFFCGPKPLGHTLHLKCNEWSQPGENGTKFSFGKVNVSHPHRTNFAGEFLGIFGYRRWGIVLDIDGVYIYIFNEFPKGIPHCHGSRSFLYSKISQTHFF